MLANERTYLAWLRTALALVAGAVAVQAPAIDLEDWVTTVVSLWLLLSAALCVGLGLTRWRAAQRAIDRDEPLPGFRGPAVLAGALMALVLGVAAGVVVVASR